MALPALPDLAVFIVLLGALIVCYLAVYFAKAFAGITGSTLGKLPIVGGWIDSGIHSVEHKIVAIFSQAASGVQSAMGWSWHLQARIIDALGREINSHANLLWMLANQIPGVGLVHFLVTEVAQAKHAVDSLLHRITHLHTGVITPIAGELKALERWTYPRVKGLERTVDHTIPKDIAGLRARTKTLEGELSRAWDAIKHNELALAGTAFAGAVALALSRLDLGWLRCSNTRSVGKALCGANPSEIEALLGLIVGVIAIEDYQQLVKLMQGVEQVTAEGIQTLLKV